LIRNLVTIPTDKKALDFLLAREILGRPFLAPPALPPERAAVLRAAFAATLRDPEFHKDAERAKLETNLVPGEEVDAVLKEATAAPAEVIERVKQALERK
jgi:tripartite-type tricarboxylate transporter receptor subunit TctC